jgi:hypothetical protein
MNSDDFEINIDEQAILSKHEILVDYSLKSLHDPKMLNAYAKKALRRAIHDEAEISKIKLKKPKIVVRALSKMLGRPAYARLYVITKF